jgi:response regulator of citrate/malate metabolism
MKFYPGLHKTIFKTLFSGLSFTDEELALRICGYINDYSTSKMRASISYLEKHKGIKIDRVYNDMGKASKQKYRLNKKYFPK